MPDDRQAVRDSARYLRSVRPIDPEEVAEYVEGGAHPAVVRQYLREMATDLDLVERADGTFVPADESPLAPAFDGVEALPDRWREAVEDLLLERYGPDWHRGESGDRLRATIRRLKEDYYRQHPVEYDDEVALAYAVYHLSDYYAVAQYVLDELGGDGLLPGNLRVLDVGAGVGGPALGLHDYLPANALVEYHAVEPSAAADVLERFLDETGRNFHPTVHRSTAEDFDPDGAFDLVLFANVLSELDAPAETAARYAEAVAADGTLVCVAAADRNTSTTLRAVERDLVDERGLGSVYAPTVRLWADERPTDRGWSFDERAPIEVPAFQERLAAAADDPDAFRNASVRYSYALLRPDGRRRYDLTLSADRAAKLGAADSFVTERVDLVVAKLSRDLGEGPGHNPLFKVSDGSERVDVYAVLVEAAPPNEALRRADYGALLSLENALVLWNDDEAAYNVVVDGQTYVDRLA
jgi:SAM-dependent methyltransferase